MSNPSKLGGRPVRLIAFDLDGTIFGDPLHQGVSPRLEAAFSAAAERGVVLVAATGRPVWMIGACLEEAPWMGWAISGNGSSIVPLKGAPAGARVIEQPIPREQAIEMLDLLSSVGSTINAHMQAKSFVENWTERPLPDFAAKLADEAAELEAAGETPAGPPATGRNPILEMMGLGLMDAVDSVADEMRADPSLRLDKLDVTYPRTRDFSAVAAAIDAMDGLEIARLGAHDVEITVAGVSKGAALGLLCAELGIDEGQAVAFGDSGNDLSMCGRAATFVAMGNATDEIKAAADEECPSVLRDGVAVWIEEHVL